MIYIIYYSYIIEHVEYNNSQDFQRTEVEPLGQVHNMHMVSGANFIPIGIIPDQTLNKVGNANTPEVKHMP